MHAGSGGRNNVLRKKCYNCHQRTHRIRDCLGRPAKAIQARGVSHKQITHAVAPVGEAHCCLAGAQSSLSGSSSYSGWSGFFEQSGFGSEHYSVIAGAVSGWMGTGELVSECMTTVEKTLPSSSPDCCPQYPFVRLCLFSVLRSSL